jgi:hypothetical protein
VSRRLVPPAILGGLDRWCAGQAALRRDIHHWITARDRTDGRWQAIAVRHGGVAAGGLAAVTTGGWPVAAAGACWAVAAWRRAPNELPPKEPEEEDEAPAPSDRRAAYLHLVAAIIGDRSGVHLANLYTTLRHYDHWADHTDPQLRALIDEIGIPVRRTMRVGPVSGRSGIHRDDLAHAMAAHGIPYPNPAPNPSPHSEEAGHSDVERPVERGVETHSTPVTVINSSRDHEPAWP